MKVSSEKVGVSQIELAIEVEPQRVEQFLERAYRRLAQRLNVPGFRRGKAPRPVVERYLGRERLFQEAIDMMVPEVCDEAVREQGLEAIDVSQVEVVQQEPVVIKATVAVRPTVDLSEYRELRVERLPIVVEEAEIDTEVEELRRRYAVQEPVQRPVQWGDIVRLELRGMVDGRPVFAEEDAQFRLHQGRLVVAEGVAEKLIGLNKGEVAEFSIVLPERYPRMLAGKECRCRVVVVEVKEEKLSALDDNFAREVGEGFTNLRALRDRLHQDIRQRAEAEAGERYRDIIVDKLVEMATVEYPAIVVEREIDRLLRDEASAGGQGDVERYLRQIGKTAEQLRDELRPQAEERVQRSLVLSKVADLEGLTVEAAEVDQEIERMIGSAGAQADQVRRLFDTPSGRDAIQRTLLTRKTVERLAAIASGQQEAVTEITSAVEAAAPSEATQKES